MTLRPELLAEQSYVHFIVPIPHCPSSEAESGGCQSAHHFGGRMVKNGDLGRSQMLSHHDTPDPAFPGFTGSPLSPIMWSWESHASQGGPGVSLQ